jgi:hypothetical protein
MDQNEMSKLYRGPSIDASYQVSYHLAKWLQLSGLNDAKFQGTMICFY